jgi:hypothetical protein
MAIIVSWRELRPRCSPSSVVTGLEVVTMLRGWIGYLSLRARTCCWLEIPRKPVEQAVVDVERIAA